MPTKSQIKFQITVKAIIPIQTQKSDSSKHTKTQGDTLQHTLPLSICIQIQAQTMISLTIIQKINSITKRPLKTTDPTIYLVHFFNFREVSNYTIQDRLLLCLSQNIVTSSSNLFFFLISSFINSEICLCVQIGTNSKITQKIVGMCDALIWTS